MTTEKQTARRTSRRTKARPNDLSNRVTSEVDGLKSWCETLNVGVVPSIHVNGYGYSFALLTVDFGQPLEPVRLNAEQTNELQDRMRGVARAIVNRDSNFRVNFDNERGVYWVSM